MIGEKQMHPQRVAVWCGFWAEGVIGPYFFENEADQATTVNAARYRDTITRFFLPKLNDIDVADMWFQQDDYRTRHFLIMYSLVSVIRIDRSCDLTPLDFFL